MTLDEAIVHCEEVAEDRAGCCEDCAEEHRQLAEWLRELKKYREVEDDNSSFKMLQIDDAISRSDTIKAVCSLCDKSLGEYAENPHIDAIIDVINSL